WCRGRPNLLPLPDFECNMAVRKKKIAGAERRVRVSGPLGTDNSHRPAAGPNAVPSFVTTTECYGVLPAFDQWSASPRGCCTCSIQSQVVEAATESSTLKSITPCCRGAFGGFGDWQHGTGGAHTAAFAIRCSRLQRPSET